MTQNYDKIFKKPQIYHLLFGFCKYFQDVKEKLCFVKKNQTKLKDVKMFYK